MVFIFLLYMSFLVQVPAFFTKAVQFSSRLGNTVLTGNEIINGNLAVNGSLTLNANDNNTDLIFNYLDISSH